MTTEAAPKGQLMYLGLAVLVLLSGLCTIFASVVTAAQAWQEHAQARWPEVTGRVDCAPPSNVDRRALRSRQPQESSAGGDRYAARRTTNAEQYEAT